MLSNNGKDEHQATQLVDGDTLFTPGSGPPPEASESATVSMESPFKGGVVPRGTGEMPATDPVRSAMDIDMTLPPSQLARVTVNEPPGSNPVRRPSLRGSPVPQELAPITEPGTSG